MLALYDRLVEAGRRDGDFAEAARIVSSARPSQAFLDYWSGMDQRLWEFLKRCQDHDPVPDALRGWLDERADTGWISSVLTEIESFRALARHAPEAASRLPAVLDLIDLIDLIPLDPPIQILAQTARPATVHSLDAIHLGTALHARQALTSFVTYDKRASTAF